ncbi:MAG: cellulase, partial [Calditrichaeota bacterium]
MSNDNRPFSSGTAKHPLAIAMWDFSWIERRWAGAGFENWDLALDELLERGYNAVRIDAFPHLLGTNPTKEWTLVPVWNQNCWGSPAVNRIILQPALEEFLEKCRERAIQVGLSCWYRQDIDDTRMKIVSPEKMAENWIKSLDIVAKAGLLETIFYVDLCNEWPGDLWTPYFQNDPPEHTWTFWHTEKSMDFMRRAIAGVRAAFPELPFCFSFTGGNPDLYAQKDLSFFDLLEHHTWLAQINEGEFDKAVGYTYDRFTPDAYDRLAENHEKIYLDRR